MKQKLIYFRQETAFSFLIPLIDQQYSDNHPNFGNRTQAHRNLKIVKDRLVNRTLDHCHDSFKREKFDKEVSKIRKSRLMLHFFARALTLLCEQSCRCEPSSSFYHVWSNPQKISLLYKNTEPSVLSTD